MAKPISNPNLFAAATSGTTVQLDANFATVVNAINDLNTYNGNYLTESGAANAYVCASVTNLTFTLSAGAMVTFKAVNANTGASTLNVFATGVKNLTNVDGSALTSGRIPANGLVSAQYDGTQYILLSVNGVCRYGFSAYRNAAYTVPATSTTKIPFDTKLFDPDAVFDAVTNNRFTATVAGKYQFCAYINGAGVGLGVKLYKNGSETLRFSDYQSTFGTSVGGAGILNLAAADYVEVYARNDSAGGIALSTGNNLSFFHGYFLGT